MLVTPGPARDAYLESQREKLPWVEHPPSRVAIAGTVVSADGSGMLVKIPPVPTSPQDSSIVFHPVPSEAVPGSDVRVDFVSSSDFLLAHGQQSLAAGSPILVMGINKGSAIRAVLVTDGSGIHHPGSLDVTASALKRTGRPRAQEGSVQLAATRVPTASSGTSPELVTAGSASSPELVGHGSVGLDGINLGINNVGFGNKGSDCPYFRFNATVTAGYGAQWNFHMHFGLDTSGKLTVVSDPASGSAVSTNNTVNHTYYSAFGGGVQWGADLGCDTPIPIPQVNLFGLSLGGGHVGLDFSYGDTWSVLLENETDQAAPLWGDKVLSVPGISCIDELSSDNIPAIGQLLSTIHGPAITVPICDDINIYPAGFRASLHVGTSPTPQGVALGDPTTRDHPSVAVSGLSPNGTVTVDTYNFVPEQDLNVTAGIELGRPANTNSKSSPSGQNPHPLATAVCRDGSVSYAQHSQGQCSGHSGIAQKLDPSSSSSGSSSDQSPDSSWSDLANGKINFGPWNVPFLNASSYMTVVWNPSVFQFGPTPPPPPSLCGADALVTAATAQVPFPTNEFTINVTRTLGTDPEWASFNITATPAFSNTFQDAEGVAECTPSGGWQIKGIGGTFVGCSVVPPSIRSQLDLQGGCPTSQLGALVGGWYQHDNFLTIDSNGTFLETCSGGGAGAPCNALGVTIAGQVSGSPGGASGSVTASQVPGVSVGDAVQFSFDSSNDTISGTMSGQSVGPFCGANAPPDFCGA